MPTVNDVAKANTFFVFIFRSLKRTAMDKQQIQFEIFFESQE